MILIIISKLLRYNYIFEIYIMGENDLDIFMKNHIYEIYNSNNEVISKFNYIDIFSGKNNYDREKSIVLNIKISSLNKINTPRNKNRKNIMELFFSIKYINDFILENFNNLGILFKEKSLNKRKNYYNFLSMIHAIIITRNNSNNLDYLNNDNYLKRIYMLEYYFTEFYDNDITESNFLMKIIYSLNIILELFNKNHYIKIKDNKSMNGSYNIEGLIDELNNKEIVIIDESGNVKIDYKNIDKYLNDYSNNEIKKINERSFKEHSNIERSDTIEIFNKQGRNNIMMYRYFIEKLYKNNKLVNELNKIDNHKKYTDNHILENNTDFNNEFSEKTKFKIISINKCNKCNNIYNHYSDMSNYITIKDINDKMKYSVDEYLKYIFNKNDNIDYCHECKNIITEKDKEIKIDFFPNFFIIDLSIYPFFTDIDIVLYADTYQLKSLIFVTNIIIDKKSDFTHHDALYLKEYEIAINKERYISEETKKKKDEIMNKYNVDPVIKIIDYITITKVNDKWVLIDGNFNNIIENLEDFLEKVIPEYSIKFLLYEKTL